jgi:hypothetical protein
LISQPRRTTVESFGDDEEEETTELIQVVNHDLGATIAVITVDHSRRSEAVRNAISVAILLILGICALLLLAD